MSLSIFYLLSFNWIPKSLSRLRNRYTQYLKGVEQYHEQGNGIRSGDGKAS